MREGELRRWDGGMEEGIAWWVWVVEWIRWMEMRDGDGRRIR